MHVVDANAARDVLAIIQISRWIGIHLEGGRVRQNGILETRQVD